MSLTFLRGQVGYMKRRGFEVVALSSPGQELQAFGEDEGIEVIGVRILRRVTPLRDIGVVASIVRQMHRVRPTIVHAHTPKGGLLGMIAAWLYRAPVRVYHMRGLPLMGARGVRRCMLWISEWIACRLAHQVLCVSRTVAGEAVAGRICSSGKIKVLLGGSGNGVDAAGRFDPQRVGAAARQSTRARLGIPSDALVIGFVGRIVRDKGIGELAAAWRELRDAVPNVHLLVAGPFEPHDPIPAESEAVLRRDPRVHLTGLDWNTPPLYAAMDVVALPTYREGFPNVPLEAAAMSLPVVATNVPGCVDAVEDGETGVLVPPRDAGALAVALRRYLEDPAMRSRHGSAGRLRVLRDFQQEVLWQSLHVEYERLLAERGVRSSAYTVHVAQRSAS
jgi:glycosyltransferase involved in cell wall biosynthesis